MSVQTMLRSFLRKFAALMLQPGVSYARKSPRFKRVVLNSLNRVPALAIKLRHLHIQYKHNQQAQQDMWHGTSAMVSVAQVMTYRCDAHQLYAMPASKGMNTECRTPLEAHFHTYVGDV